MSSIPPFSPSIADELRPFMEKALVGSDYLREMEKLANMMFHVAKEHEEEYEEQYEEKMPSKIVDHFTANMIRMVKKQYKKKMSSEKKKPSKVFDPSTTSKPISIIKTLIIHNIPRDCCVTDIRYLFEKYGPIRDIYIPRNMDRFSPFHGTIKGFALIKFYNAMDAQSAYDAEFGRLYIGFRLISVEFAKEER